MGALHSLSKFEFWRMRLNETVSTFYVTPPKSAPIAAALQRRSVTTRPVRIDNVKQRSQKNQNRKRKWIELKKWKQKKTTYNNETKKKEKKKKTATTKTQRERKREKAKHGIFRIKQLKSATGANETDADVLFSVFQRNIRKCRMQNIDMKRFIVFKCPMKRRIH